MTDIAIFLAIGIVIFLIGLFAPLLTRGADKPPISKSRARYLLWRLVRAGRL